MKINDSDVTPVICAMGVSQNNRSTPGTQVFNEASHWQMPEK